MASAGVCATRQNTAPLPEKARQHSSGAKARGIPHKARLSPNAENVTGAASARASISRVTLNAFHQW